MKAYQDKIAEREELNRWRSVSAKTILGTKMEEEVILITAWFDIGHRLKR